MTTYVRPPNVPPNATVDAYGNWFLPNGDFITSSSGQTTPTAAQTAATPGPVQTDPATGKSYRLINGQRWYMPPAAGPSDPGGGLIHGRTQWNPQTGAYDTPLDWGKILSMVAAGIITAGAADAVMASTPALATTAGGTTTAAGTTAAGTTAAGAGAAGTTATGTTAALAPSTAANVAATSSVVGGSSVPAALSVGTGAVAPAATSSSAVPWGTIVGAGTQLFGNLFAAHEQSAAADRAAEIAAAGSKYSADLAAKANADTLKFQYASSENAFQNSEAARQGNYGIFAARERRLGTIGEEVGLGPREIPAYVPGVDPGFGTLGEAAAGPTPGTSASTSPSSLGTAAGWMSLVGDTPQLTQWVQGNLGAGADPNLVGYYVGKIKGQPGANPSEQAGGAAFWAGKLAQARGGGSASPSAPSPTPTSGYATSATPYMNVIPVAAGVPQNLGYYA